jgi:hypothetical protein
MPYGCSLRFSLYGTKAIPVRVGDATRVLAEILDKEAELLIVEQTIEALGSRA